uniref:NADH-ubiquinone oxidoreductase chain 3 n=1 Tax=Agenocimbex maculatus TaxID=2507170 RepID=A0A977TJ58_9HYME|nr:NADH dehydrogenase subunit 3 [Agenocimbex maculatus]
MKLLFINICLIILLASMLMLLSSLLSKKSSYDREKSSPFECGFDPLGNPRLSFSIRFFLIAVIFLIFDVELALILPAVLITAMSNLKLWLIISSYFIFILILGTLYEWKFGALNWL